MLTSYKLKEELALITPGNICETNLRRAYEIYLQTFALNIVSSTDLMTELEAIAIQCPLEGGIGVHMAESMYNGLTGISLTRSNCDDIEERGKQNCPDLSAVSLYPNPNQGSFAINLPSSLSRQYTLLRILDARGSFVKNITVNGEQEVTFDLANQPNGLYFVVLLSNGITLKVLPFVIQQ